MGTLPGRRLLWIISKTSYGKSGRANSYRVHLLMVMCSHTRARPTRSRALSGCALPRSRRARCRPRRPINPLWTASRSARNAAQSSSNRSSIRTSQPARPAGIRTSAEGPEEKPGPSPVLSVARISPFRSFSHTSTLSAARSAQGSSRGRPDVQPSLQPILPLNPIGVRGTL